MQPSVIAREFRHFLSPDAVIDPQDARYDRLRRVWNGTIDRRPALIVLPRDASEVAACVRLAASTGLPLAVRCGGHSFPGFSTCDDGLLVDLSGLAGVRVHPDRQMVDVGGGSLLGDLDRATAPLGLVTPAGLVSHTGAGGLTLGGGMGWTSRRLGLTIDSLVSAELVMADGEIREIDATSDPELFWGLRGGGGNFGIVTRFRFRLHPLGHVTVGAWLYPPARVEQALQGMAERMAQAPRSQTCGAVLTAQGLRVTSFHSGEDGLGRDSVIPFGNLAGPGEGGLVDTDYVTLQSRSDEGARWGRRYYAKGGFLASLEEPSIAAMATMIGNPPSPDAEIYMLQLGGAVSDVAEDATAYSGRAAQLFWIVQPIWDDPADDAACMAWGQEGGRILASISQAGNYVNEQSDSGQHVAVLAYGQGKYERLARLKARCDPGNLFRLNQNIAPAVAPAA